MPTWIFLLMAVIAGFALPTQAAINSKLSAIVQYPVLAGLISFLIGTLALFVYCLCSGVPLRAVLFAKNASAIVWTGGLLGAYFISATIILVPKLGVALTFSLIIAGQMLITLVLDHYGLLGVPVKTVNLPRFLGVLLIIAGVILIRRF
ncbi:MAG: DMT family transporter [Lewinellaceae bacterium]|jgi:transporter family-2 protein|nr:DMT family transporter [Lewinellaceae bacterium]